MITLFKSHGLLTDDDKKEIIKEIKSYQDDLDVTEDDIKEFIDNDFELLLDAVRKFDADVIVTGTIGRWNGKFEIDSESTGRMSLEEGLEKAINDGIYDVKVYDDDGDLCVDAYHHDGCNHIVFKREDGSKIDLLKGEN